MIPTRTEGGPMTIVFTVAGGLFVLYWVIRLLAQLVYERGLEKRS